MGIHNDKITFYCTTRDSIALDESVLALRKLGIRVDRGAVIRAALSLALPYLSAEGRASGLYQSLASRETAGLHDDQILFLE
jgi:hypothetical protein